MSDEINKDALSQIKALMGDKFSGLVETYLRAGREHIGNIRVGYESGDAQKIIDAAHAMKSSSGNMGLVKLSSTAAALEQTGREVLDGDKAFDSLGGLVTSAESLFVSGDAFLSEQV